MALNLSKQALLINETQLRQWTVHIFGLGSIGSHLGRALAKSGFVNIVGYDFDIVEEDNIPAQAYSLKHIDMKKTEAFKQILEEECGVTPVVVDGKIDEGTNINIEQNAIYFCAFDSIPARKLVWDKVKGYNVPYGESRIGRFDYRYYFVTEKTGDKWKEEYEGLLDLSQPISDLMCGEKCSFGPNTDLVSRILRQILNILEGKELTYLFISNWQTPDESIKRVI